MILVLLGHQLGQEVFHLVGGGALPAPSHFPGEKEAQGIDAPGALEVFLPDGPTDCRLVNGQVLGDVGQAEGEQMAAGLLKKALLSADNGLGAVQQGGAALLHRLDGELGLFNFVGEVLFYFDIGALFLQSAVVAAQLQGGDVRVLIDHGRPVLCLHHGQIRN